MAFKNAAMRIFPKPQQYDGANRVSRLKSCSCAQKLIACRAGLLWLVGKIVSGDMVDDL